MTAITFNPDKHTYTELDKKFTMSEKDVPRFDTQYKILNHKTGGGMDFNFSHSTGPEFEPSTKWVYLSEEGYTLEVCNDPKMAEEAKKNYIKGKHYGN
jgi:hypothetical protein